MKELPNTMNDANALEKTFTDLGYTVSSAKDVGGSVLDKLFEDFLQSLHTRTYAVILHVACHGEEKDGHLVLKLPDNTEVYVDEYIGRLNRRLDELVRQSQSPADPVKDVGVILFWDACREQCEAKMHLPRRVKLRKNLRERQQVMIYSCMSGGQSDDGSSESSKSPFTAALQELLGANTPFNVFELSENLNAKMKAATRGRQAVELSAEFTNLNMRYDWFVDLDTCNKLRTCDVRLQQLKALSDDLRACARLISLWKVPCGSANTVDDYLRSAQDAKQKLLSDLRAPWVDSFTNAKQQAADAEQAKATAQEKAKAFEQCVADAEQKVADMEQAKETAQEKAKALELRVAEAEQRVADAEQAKVTAQEKAKALELRVADAEQRVADAEQAKITAQEKVNVFEQRATDAEERANDAAEAKAEAEYVLKEAKLARASAEHHIVSVIEQLANDLHSCDPNDHFQFSSEIALRRFGRKLLETNVERKATASGKRLQEVLEQSRLRDFGRTRPRQCGTAWRRYYPSNEQPTRCDKCEETMVDGVHCERGCHTVCFKCLEGFTIDWLANSVQQKQDSRIRELLRIARPFFTFLPSFGDLASNT